ncbi:hypothetical protein [Cryobacterium sp. Y57]|uniref:hypothetical protein n=1 Tax=Cryobacterium sp. Y57 TaxID=2048287 RepID=UPI0011AFF2D8|nr:hypothetical protein [Cryobacterium sp. Y57]
MTDFESWFGPSDIIRLERTFRFLNLLRMSPALSSCRARTNRQKRRFVNRRVCANGGNYDARSRQRRGSSHPSSLTTLHSRIPGGAIPSAPGRELSMLVLGRYLQRSRYLDGCKHLADLLDISLMTMHASKGGTRTMEQTAPTFPERISTRFTGEHRAKEVLLVAERDVGRAQPVDDHAELGNVAATH